jgi:hypothetical protein
MKSSNTRCKIFVLSLLGCVSVGVAAADEAQIVAEIKKHAEACAQAQMRLDFDKFIPYVPTKLLGFMGGKEGLTQTITKGTEEMKRRGITIERVTIGAPEKPKRHGTTLVSLVPQKLVMTTPQGRLTTDSHLLAISENSGESWVFVDAASLNDEKLGILYPDLKGNVESPQMKTKLAE